MLLSMISASTSCTVHAVSRKLHAPYSGIYFASHTNSPAQNVWHRLTKMDYYATKPKVFNRRSYSVKPVKGVALRCVA